MDIHRQQDLESTLSRIAAALERIAPAPDRAPDLSTADCFVFEPPMTLRPVQQLSLIHI